MVFFYWAHFRRASAYKKMGTSSESWGLLYGGADPGIPSLITEKEKKKFQ